jgi:hypothetical protein
MADTQQKAAFDLAQETTTQLEAFPVSVSGTTVFATHTFNGIATQYNTLERLITPASPVKQAKHDRASFSGKEGAVPASTVRPI